METAPGTDMRVGLAALFGLLGIGGAFVMLVAGLGEAQVVSGWAFAGAMLFATLLVAGLHMYD